MERRIKSRLVKATIVVDPPPEYRLKHPGEILQGFVTTRMPMPAPQFAPKIAHGLGTRRWTAIDAVLSPSILRPSGAKRITQKIEAFLWVVPSPVIIFTVDNLRLLRMKLHSTRGKPLVQLLPHALRLRLRSTVAHRIIGVAFERDVRVVMLHPDIKRVVQKEVR